MIRLSVFKKLHSNNKGMSLVETLVGIAILSAAVGPLLYMFVYTTKFNAKARVKQRATNAAMTVMENLKASDMRTVYRQFAVDGDGNHFNATPFLYNNPGATYREVGASSSDYSGVYWIDGMSFSDPGSTDTNTYDVQISANVERSVDITETPIFDKYRDLIFEEKTDDIELSYDPYYIADAILKYEDISADDVSSIKIDRKIYLSVDSTSQMTVEYKYKYVVSGGGGASGTYEYVAGDDSRKHLKVVKSLPQKADGSYNSIGNIYFYYYPAYKNAYTTNPDGTATDYVINVNSDEMYLKNTCGKAVNLFVSRQYTTQPLLETVVKILDGSYQLKVNGTTELTSPVNVFNTLCKTNITGGNNTLNEVALVTTSPNNALITVSGDSGLKENVALTTGIVINIYDSVTPGEAHGDSLVSINGTLVGFNSL